MPKTKPSKLPSAWKIMRSSLREYRASWKPYVKILALVAIPANLFLLVTPASADDAVQSYIMFASVIMNVALIWAIVQRETTGTVSKASAAYYDGSVAVVRFVLVSFALTAMMLPAAIGATLYKISMQAAEYTGSYGPEQFVLGLVALILAIPSFYLLVRHGLAPFAAIRNNLRPVAALKRSRIYTLGRFWPTAGRFVLLGIFLLILLLPTGFIYFLLTLPNIDKVPKVVFNILATLTVLPIANIYMMRLYRTLEHAQSETAE